MPAFSAVGLSFVGVVGKCREDPTFDAEVGAACEVHDQARQSVQFPGEEVKTLRSVGYRVAAVFDGTRKTDLRTIFL